MQKPSLLKIATEVKKYHTYKASDERHGTTPETYEALREQHHYIETLKKVSRKTKRKNRNG